MFFCFDSAKTGRATWKILDPANAHRQEGLKTPQRTPEWNPFDSKRAELFVSDSKATRTHNARRTTWVIQPSGSVVVWTVDINRLEIGRFCCGCEGVWGSSICIDPARCVGSLCSAPVVVDPDDHWVSWRGASIYLNKIWSHGGVICSLFDCISAEFEEINLNTLGIPSKIVASLSHSLPLSSFLCV